MVSKRALRRKKRNIQILKFSQKVIELSNMKQICL
eukprot:XP_001705281.1 Hypothetical protein GL50803_1969 [Giardia lamblia ATCC 50803]